MTRSDESGGYQGAISSMVSVVDVCPSCGKSPSEHRRAFPLAGARQCTEIAVGAFPFIPESPRVDDEPLSPPTFPSSGRYPAAPEETATGVFASPFPAGRAPRRADLLTMTWNLTHGTEEFP